MQEQSSGSDKNEGCTCAQKHGLPFTKTNLATAAAECSTCQTPINSLLWHHPL